MYIVMFSHMSFFFFLAFGFLWIYGIDNIHGVEMQNSCPTTMYSTDSTAFDYDLKNLISPQGQAALTVASKCWS